MKKLFLLLATGSFAMYANAQENMSILLAKPANANFTLHPLTGNHNHFKSTNTVRSASRTTSPGTTISTWYDLWDQNAISSVSNGFFFEIYPDSNLVDNSGATPEHTFWHGMGMSFDPTDSAYSLNAQVTANSPMPLTGQSYTVDSFFVNGKYIRNNNAVTDSLIIELVVTQEGTIPPDSGAYNLQFTTANVLNAPICYDEKPRFGDIWYTNTTNDCYFDNVLTTKERYAIALNAAFLVDTDANGDNPVQIPLSPAFNLNSNQHLVSYVTFKSGTNYALGTDINSANLYHLFAGETNGSSFWNMQSSANTAASYPGSYQDGVISSSQIRYSDTGFTFEGHDILVSSYAYAGSNASNTPPGFDVPEQAFHVIWDSTGGPNAVVNVNHVISTVTASPNPANGTLNIAFSLVQNADVTVTLTNMVGQVVATQKVANTTGGTATFNTSILPAGDYIYTLNANNVRSVGQVVIAH